jgi:hypothetical protein
MSASLTPPFLAPWSDPAPPRVMVRHLRPRTAERPAVPAMPRGPCAARGPRGELGGAPRHASLSGRCLSRAVSGSVQPTVAEATWALHSVSRARGRSASIHRRARDPSCGAALRHRPDEGVIGIAPTRADDVRRRDAGGDSAGRGRDDAVSVAPRRRRFQAGCEGVSGGRPSGIPAATRRRSPAGPTAAAAWREPCRRAACRP